VLLNATANAKKAAAANQLLRKAAKASSERSQRKNEEPGAEQPQ
jgi:hypothetical protein